jgi:hypothetical protein
MNAQVMTRNDLEAAIVKHSWADEGFRREFLADPAGAFSKYLEVPADRLPKIVVHEETAGSWHIVLPAKADNTSELSEADLEKIAGGTSPAFITAVVVSTGSLVSVSVTVTEGGW